MFVLCGLPFCIRTEVGSFFVLIVPHAAEPKYGVIYSYGIRNRLGKGTRWIPELGNT